MHFRSESETWSHQRHPNNNRKKAEHCICCVCVFLEACCFTLDLLTEVHMIRVREAAIWQDHVTRHGVVAVSARACIQLSLSVPPWSALPSGVIVGPGRDEPTFPRMPYGSVCFG